MFIFALTDEGEIVRIPKPTETGDVEDAAMQTNKDVVMTFDKSDMVRLQENITALLEAEATEEALRAMEAMTTPQAMWWFIENIPSGSPTASECFFALRERIAKNPFDTKPT